MYHMKIITLGFLFLKFLSLFVNRVKINLNEISHDSAMGLVIKVLGMGVLLTEVNLSLDLLS